MSFLFICEIRRALRGRLHGAFSMCVFMSGEPFDAEACDIGGQASATNGTPDMKTHIENAACNRPLTPTTCHHFTSALLLLLLLLPPYPTRCEFIVKKLNPL
jgi:hypothetical protein